MIRLLGFYKRRADITHQQFLDHWINIHGPLVARIPGVEKYLKKYIQHRLYLDPLSQCDLLYDGFSESWWDSWEDRDTFLKLPAFDEIIEDERRFIDLGVSRWMVQDEQALQIDVLAEWPHPFLRPAR